MRKNIAELIDELCTVNQKIFVLIDKVIDDKFEKDDARKIQTLNRYRSELKNAINQFFNERQEVKI